jgi:molybdopterin-guanine dinucleotide biosynthesis protein A
MSSHVAVVILAGGEGRRIGGGKPLRRLAGERLIDRALRAARSWSDLVAVAVRDPAQVEWLNAAIITDEPNIPGPLGGLAAALRFGAASATEFVLTIPVDTPFLPRDLCDRLRSELGEAGCSIAASGGQLHPVCSLWRTCAASRLEDYLAGERRSLRAFAALVGLSEVEWPSEPFDPFFNVNAPADLTDAERLAAD